MTHGTERDDLIAELAAARAALVTTTNGLTDEQAGERPTVSALCLGGLVKHVASMEENWQRFAVDGPSAAIRYDLPDGVSWADMAAGTAREYPQWAIDHQNDFAMQPGETLAGVLARYEDVAKRSEEIVAKVDLSTTHPLPDAPWNRPGTTWTARRAILHIISETAQHAGHADLLRETLDGQKST